MKTTTTIAASLGAITLGLSSAVYAQTTTPAPGTNPMQTTPIPPSSDQSTTTNSTLGTAPTTPAPDAQALPQVSAGATVTADADATKKGKKHAAAPL